jgi:hypothetical protein
MSSWFAKLLELLLASCHYMPYWFIIISDIWNFFYFVMTNGPAYLFYMQSYIFLLHIILQNIYLYNITSPTDSQ